MTKGFIKKHLSTIKELLISKDLVDKNWEPGEIYVIDSKWGGFKNDYFRISFTQKWVYKDDNVEPNCININGKNVYWSYDRRDESAFDVKYLIGRDSRYGIRDEKTINYWLDKGVIPEPFPR
jgi:hypothetical protein